MNNEKRPLRAWGVCVIQHPRAPPQPAVESFVQKFSQIYEGHGGRFDSHPQYGKKPWIGPGNLADGGELGKPYYRAFEHYHINSLQSRRPGMRPVIAITTLLAS